MKVYVLMAVDFSERSLISEVFSTKVQAIEAAINLVVRMTGFDFNVLEKMENKVEDVWVFSNAHIYVMVKEHDVEVKDSNITKIEVPNYELSVGKVEKSNLKTHLDEKITPVMAEKMGLSHLIDYSMPCTFQMVTLAPMTMGDVKKSPELALLPLDLNEEQQYAITTARTSRLNKFEYEYLDKKEILKQLKQKTEVASNLVYDVMEEMTDYISYLQSLVEYNYSLSDDNDYLFGVPDADEQFNFIKRDPNNKLIY